MHQFYIVLRTVHVEQGGGESVDCIDSYKQPEDDHFDRNM
jgi:hypothetical protein